MYFSSFLSCWMLNFCQSYPRKSTNFHVVKLGSLLIYVNVTCSFVGEWWLNLCWELPRLSLPSLTYHFLCFHSSQYLPSQSQLSPLNTALFEVMKGPFLPQAYCRFYHCTASPSRRRPRRRSVFCWLDSPPPSMKRLIMSQLVHLCPLRSWIADVWDTESQCWQN